MVPCLAQFWCFRGRKQDCVIVSPTLSPVQYCSIDCLFGSSIGSQILPVLPPVLAAGSQAYDGAAPGRQKKRGIQ